jgi:hypothetical protein
VWAPTPVHRKVSHRSQTVHCPEKRFPGLVTQGISTWPLVLLELLTDGTRASLECSNPNSFRLIRVIPPGGPPPPSFPSSVRNTLSSFFLHFDSMLFLFAMSLLGVRFPLLVMRQLADR